MAVTYNYMVTSEGKPNEPPNRIIEALRSGIGMDGLPIITGPRYRLNDDVIW